MVLERPKPAPPGIPKKQNGYWPNAIADLASTAYFLSARPDMRELNPLGSWANNMKGREFIIPGLGLAGELVADKVLKDRVPEWIMKLAAGLRGTLAMNNMRQAQGEPIFK